MYCHWQTNKVLGNQNRECTHTHYIENLFNYFGTLHSNTHTHTRIYMINDVVMCAENLCSETLLLLLFGNFSRIIMDA